MNSETCRENGEAVDFTQDVPLISDLGIDYDSPWPIIHEWLAVDSVTNSAQCVGTLSTVDDNGVVSSRSMNLKFAGENISMATHRGSRKWSGSASNRNASWHVYWPKLRRQLNIRGSLHEAPVGIAQKWWDARPASMDFVSALSAQSHEATAAQISHLRTRAQEHVPQKLSCPESFIVLALEPHEVEFWEGDFSRVHHRSLYLSTSNTVSRWERKILLP